MNRPGRALHHVCSGARVAVAAIAILFFGTPASAATIFVPLDDSVFASILVTSTGGIVGFDTRGLSAGTVEGFPGEILAVGGNEPFPSNQLFMVTLDLSEIIMFTLAFPGTGPTNGLWQIPAQGVAATVISNPAMLPFIDSVILQFREFCLPATEPNGQPTCVFPVAGTDLLQLPYTLESVTAVPEPGTLLMVGSGVTAVFAARRRRRT